jgi:hypothetical protein
VIDEFKRINPKFVMYPDRECEDNTADCEIEYVRVATSKPLTPSEIFTVHRYIHERLGYLVSKADCDICPVVPENVDNGLDVYTIVIGLPDHMSMCPIKCRHCYAKPVEPDSTLIKRVESMVDQIVLRLRLIIEDIMRVGHKGIPHINIIPWGGNSDPTILNSDYYRNIIENLTHWIWDSYSTKNYVEVSFMFNISTSSPDTTEIRRLYNVFNTTVSRLRYKEARWDPIDCGLKDSLFAVTAYRPDLFSDNGGDEAFTYMYRMFSLPSHATLPPRRLLDSVIFTPVFIADKYVEEFLPYMVAVSYWFGYVPLILSPYGTSTELYRFFNIRNTGQVGNILKRVLWNFMHVYEAVKLDTCSYNALFGGVKTPEIYKDRFIRVYVDPTDNRVSHKVHDGTWCPRGVYTFRGCIYPPRPPPTTT